MDTLKTAAVVVLLLAVLYGVYVVLNRPGTGLPEVGGAGTESAEGALNIEIPGVGVEADQFAGLEPFDPSELDGGSKANSDTTPPPFDAPSMSIDTPPMGPEDTHFKAHESDFSGGAGITGSPAGQGSSNPPDSVDPSSLMPGQGAESNADRMGRNLGALNFRRDWESAQRMIDDGRFVGALESLSKYYQSPDLTQDQHQALLDVLDALAGKVIYSNEPLAGEPLFVVRGQSLMEIAQQYNVPWQLLRNINGLRDPDVLLNNTQLKVVRGPFRAEVSLTRHQLTLFLGNLYAGRFDISVGDERAEPGTYSVLQIADGKTYVSADNLHTVPAGEARNPYGQHFLDLGRGVSIHGSPTSGIGQDKGCIGLAPRDAKDVSSILARGSTVTIVR